MLFLAVLAIYMGVLLLLNGSSNLVVLLIFLESMSWIFSLMILKESFKYLILQAYFMVLSITGLLIFPEILMGVLLMKLGLPPFHAWVIRLSNLLGKNSLGFFMTVHKFPPLLFLGTLMTKSSTLFVSVLTIGMALLMLAACTTLLPTLLVSSMMHSGWMLMAMTSSKLLVCLYWFFYSLLIVALLVMVGKFLTLSSLKQSSSMSMFWLVVSGLPPFLIFWFKLNVVLLFIMSSTVIVLSLMTVVVMSISAYFRVFSISLNSKETAHGWEFTILALVALFMLY